MPAVRRSPLLYVVALLALTFALAAPLAPVEAAPSGPSDRAEATTYIVVLDQGDPQQVAAEHAQRHGAQIRHVYQHALRGYAAQMSERAAQRIARDDRVAYVEADGLVTIAHHQCGHTGGPPGSGDPACESGTISGTVTATGGDGIQGATIAVDNTTVSTSTDSNGSYVTEAVDGGTYTVTASADGYQSASQSVDVDGNVTGVDFALEPDSDGGGDDPPQEDSDQVEPWGVLRVGALDAVGTGEGIHVYVIDTGIDQSHADLAANLGDGVAIERCRGGGCVEPWDDDHGHGTHVAGTIGAVDNLIDVVGVAPRVTLHSVKVLAKNGMGSRSGVIAGIDWMRGHVSNGFGGKAVANMSLGGSGSKSGTCTANGFTGTDSYHEAICDATNAGIVFAVAAGNSGADADGAVPAAYDDAVITVSATNSNDAWPSWSNWGNDEADWTGANSAPVAIAAPGVSVLSTQLGGGTTTMSGTSMAAPHVAGGVALVLEASDQDAGYSAFTNARAALLDTAANTAGWNTGGNPHDEPFLDVRGW